MIIINISATKTHESKQSSSYSSIKLTYFSIFRVNPRVRDKAKVILLISTDPWWNCRT